MGSEPHLWPLARRFSWMRLSIKSMASTERAASARLPVKRPMPAPSSTTRLPSTQPSMRSTCAAAFTHLTSTPFAMRMHGTPHAGPGCPTDLQHVSFLM